MGTRLRVLTILCAVVILLALPVQVLAASPSTDLTEELSASTTPITGAELRAGPRNNSLLIGYLLHGTKLTVLGESGGFYQLDVYDLEAYMEKASVELREDGEYYVNCTNSDRGKIFYARSSADTLAFQEALVAEARKYLGVPYLLGGKTPEAFDCSGYTQYVYRQLGISIRRICTQQIGDGVAVPLEDIQVGDLVLFQKGSPRFVSHVGVYVGSGYVLQSGDNGVSYMSVNGPYFRENLRAVRRIVITEPAATEIQAGIQFRTVADLTPPQWVRTRTVPGQ